LSEKSARHLATRKRQLFSLRREEQANTAAATSTAIAGSGTPIDPSLLPDEYREKPLVYAGLYRVEITHPRTLLASRYNTASELGCGVVPAARNGTLSKFDLRSK
jgi:hypothetical protein